MMLQPTVFVGYSLGGLTHHDAVGAMSTGGWEWGARSIRAIFGAKSSTQCGHEVNASLWSGRYMKRTDGELDVWSLNICIQAI